MKLEVSQRFFFDAAHTLERAIETESSRRIHGHTYHAEIALTGEKDPAMGMVVDLGRVRARLAVLREELDHRFLDEVEGLGKPTLENLCGFIWLRLEADFPQISRVTVWREAIGDRCTLSR